ncbi:MAG: hypothetical protein IPI00_13340 [Flavobacteriales bacterium]|nr:hypothetical protein [Flavobacteriales bacterium]MBK6944735.1 hypothetical protein [Flavobacteriales bacterium]MBK7241119.1 hypothetical protein [Flavobacteriales bacterium]MBK7295735.1 hypothetical protein [Flavobacteriales bacterium]MBP9137187.1 hypothetical protein [Flavobacteriales bacterium]
MIHITFQTRTEEAAEKLAGHLMEKHLLLFPTIDTDHEELTWAGGAIERNRQLLLQGMSKALLYRELESEAYALLGEDLVRMHAVPVVSMDPHAQQVLLEQTAKV